MADREFIIAPVTVSVKFQLRQAVMLDNSLHLIASTAYGTELDSWIYDTNKALTDEQRLQHSVVMHATFGHVSFVEPMTFPEYINRLKAVDPEAMAKKSVAWIDEEDGLPSSAEATRDVDTFVDVVRLHYQHKRETKGYDMPFDESLWRETYRYMMSPDELHTLVINHLTMMWERYVQSEWNRRKPVLEESANAYARMDYSGMSPFDVIETVTGRDMRDKFADIMNRVDTIIMSPSPHVGPYIGLRHDEDNRVLHLFFRANLPKGVQQMASPALNRSELQARLSALADDTRLRMVELLIEHEELCAQDFINLLELSQSSASRHLRQLTASGYLIERRQEVAKCYRLNNDRIEDTLSALRQFLTRTP